MWILKRILLMMIRYRVWTAVVATVLLGGAGGTLGQEAPGGVPRRLAEASVRAGLDAARATEAQTIDEQIRFCEVPAPPFKESTRAQVLQDAFQELGLQNV